MQGCVARAIQTILSTINGIFKREKTISGIPRNRGRKNVDFQKMINRRFAEICELGEKNSRKNHMYVRIKNVLNFKF